MRPSEEFDTWLQQLGLVREDLVSEEKILAALCRRLEYMMEYAPEQLFSLLYRLDISERKLKQAMEQETDIVAKIALLIYERQVEKSASRKAHKSTPPDPDIAW